MFVRYDKFSKITDRLITNIAELHDVLCTFRKHKEIFQLHENLAEVHIVLCALRKYKEGTLQPENAVHFVKNVTQACDLIAVFQADEEKSIQFLFKDENFKRLVTNTAVDLNNLLRAFPNYDILEERELEPISPK